MSQAHTLLGDLEDPQVELHLLQFERSHICFAVFYQMLYSHFFPDLLPFSMPILIVFALLDSALYQTTLPFCLVGLSLCDSVNTAYLCCCNDVLSLS